MASTRQRYRPWLLSTYPKFLCALAATALVATAARGTRAAADGEQVRGVVEASYCNGAYNALDAAVMARGVHPDFAILDADGDKLERYPLPDWMKAIELRKAKPGFDPASARRDCRLVAVDVTGHAAMVKAEIFRDGKILYTDYLSLLRFSRGWRIVSKVYFQSP